MAPCAYLCYFCCNTFPYNSPPPTPLPARSALQNARAPFHSRVIGRIGGITGWLSRWVRVVSSGKRSHNARAGCHTRACRSPRVKGERDRQTDEQKRRGRDSTEREARHAPRMASQIIIICLAARAQRKTLRAFVCAHRMREKFINFRHAPRRSGGEEDAHANSKPETAKRGRGGERGGGVNKSKEHARFAFRERNIEYLR